MDVQHSVKWYLEINMIKHVNYIEVRVGNLCSYIHGCHLAPDTLKHFAGRINIFIYIGIKQLCRYTLVLWNKSSHSWIIVLRL